MAEPAFADDAAIPWTDLGGGIRRKVLTHDDRVMMVRVAFESGAVGEPHRHPHVQVSFVASGVFDVTVGGRTERLAAGASFLVPGGVEHGCRAVEAGSLVDVFAPPRAEFLQVSNRL
jgi:quercetin dioxygenase-like cupin family protein